MGTTDRRGGAIDQLQGRVFDVLVVGAGVNGAVAARACAAAGLRVALVDASDYGGATSQESSNLIWGGFKYLEGYEIGLVARLCRSRNELARAYPTQVQQTRFLAALGATSPYSPTFATAGSYAYWAIGRFFTDRPRRRSRAQIGAREPAIALDGVRGGIEYSDFYLPDNDARFVFNFVADAVRDGAVAVNYANLLHAERRGDGWCAQLQDVAGGELFEVSARVLVNATGPRAARVNDALGVATHHRIVLSKGIHLVVPRVTTSGRVFAFYDDTKRLFYVIPMGHRSVIGTTDTRVDEVHPEVTDEDRRSVLEQANARLELDRPLEMADIISERCGVRSLIADPGSPDVPDAEWTSMSRKHAIEVDPDRKVVSVLGGKLSDCINVGDEILGASRELGLRPREVGSSWYGEPPAGARHDFLHAAAGQGLARPAEVEFGVTYADVLWRRYGTDAYRVLDRLRLEPESGEPIAPMTDVTAAEVPLMAEREHIVRFEDFLRRRTKLGLIHRASDLAGHPGVEAARHALEAMPRPREAQP